MTLSILIPVYNFDIKNLVTDLYKQCEELKIDFEIVLTDDFSEENYHKINKKLDKIPNVSYERLNQNIGRSKIRNYLLNKARYQNCLILDCDVAIVSKDFIKKYIDVIDKDGVIVGGHIYKKTPPKNKKLMLHWKYGTQVECKSLKERLKNPYNSFMTNSFLIQKKVFDIINFEEVITKYGHEDTLFGIELETNRIPIQHIDNPVLHLGLKPAKDFLAGEKEAISNLVFLSKTEKVKDKIIKKSKLLRLEKSILLKWYYLLTEIYFSNSVEKSLLSDNPSLKFLNFWKYKTLKELRKLN